ncbi:MAG: Vitamin B12 dependent methionine synthase activation subunit [Clostridia bacterium]|nr:Vitamin B12 dependent methionine synthase activation subunit [Clostridia bacterium]
MENTVYTKIYAPPPFNRKEILRYAGITGNAPELSALIDECIAEAEREFTYKVCFARFKVERNNEMLDLGFTKTKSVHLGKNLSGCESVLLFAATIGLGIDRLISRYSKISPTKALILQAVGAERIESLCEVFACDVQKGCAEAGYAAKPRFSPGYGDFSLEVQKDIFAVLDCPRKIGLSLNESLLMSPTKSVTAIIGIKS